MLKETAWDSTAINNADDIFSLLGLNLKKPFEKIEDWYASCCADFETAERILYSEIDVSMYQNLYEYPEENEDFEIVDGKLIAYYGSDSHTCVPYEVHTIGTEAFNAEVLMTQLTIRGTTMESRSVSNCGDLYSLYIPKSVTTIQSEAIYNCPNVTIYGYTGTAAETYAKNNNIPFHSLGMATPYGGVYVSGDYTLSSGTLDLDGQTMYVGGDFLNLGGTLKIGSGKLVIFGNYISERTNYNGDTYYGGYLNMQTDSGYLLVYGDYYEQSYSENKLTAGTIEIKGDFTQKSGYYNGYSEYSNFAASGTHKVILSGTVEQIISFEKPTSSYFNILEVKNQTGLVEFGMLSIRGGIVGDIISDTDITLYPIITMQNQKIQTPNLHIPWGTMYLNDGVEFDGNLYNDSCSIYLQGNVTISGNYTSMRRTYNDDTHSGGYLNMQTDSGYLLVYGDYYEQSYSENKLTAGTIEIKGDFTQKSGYYNGYSEYSNFAASGTHKVILSGTGEQIISFEKPTSSYFNILINKNPYGVVFATAYRYNELQTIYPFDFEVVEYSAETHQINVDVALSEDLQSLNGNVIISLYDDNNRLIECRIKELSELETQTFNGLTDYEGTYIVKAFYWEDMTNFVPLCKSIEALVEP